MMKLNNKGFAITGILYTLFILFLLILVSVLGGLSAKKNLLEQSIISQEDIFLGKKIPLTEAVVEKENPEDNTIDKITLVSGKYIFQVNGSGKCVAYLKKGINLTKDKITYIPNDYNNNDYDMNFELIEVYSFEEEWSIWKKEI